MDPIWIAGIVLTAVFFVLAIVASVLITVRIISQPTRGDD